ncbi:galactose mutarotase [Lentisphaera profundi]|uniref:Aldose 1-epimerase n=1 Tax=Lentisphaera profundi TaxID=1658616 RepID=A0ABY7VU82_9BACT|nr:aldose epimerase family protein [Lentisphaera profundi]WDE97740.1 galactose mutarotase [Lentisphaera profundi]
MVEKPKRRLVKKILISGALFLLLAACKSSTTKFPALNAEDFCKTIDGKKTDLFTLKNTKGMQVSITNYGARVVSILAADKDGIYGDVVSGFNTLDEYITCPEPFHGPIVGRVCNRIKSGKFKLDGKEYCLSVNNGVNHLHGGTKGFHHQVWDVKKITPSSVELHYLSKDGEMGYPGNLSVDVRYELTDKNEFLIEYKAFTDKKTVVNLTWHPFFNLAGEGITINDHILMINADRYTPVDETLIPLGQNVTVENTPFDFSTPKAIGRDLWQQKDNTQLKHGAGYDHNWVLNRPSHSSLALAARLIEPRSGRVMEIYTQEPGLQFYGGNFFDGKTIGKNGLPQIYRGALALETQRFPDAPNQKDFPSIVLAEGDLYETRSIYKFSVLEQ